MKVSKTPVRARRGWSPQPMRSRIQRVLTTTDLSNESIAGVCYAVALAEKVGAVVDVLHVVELPPPPPMPGMRSLIAFPQDSKIAKQARARLRKLAIQETTAHLRLTPLLRTGNSFYGIITAAQKRAADLIVIATHGHTRAKPVFLGSTAERVVRHAPCPVLTVPTRITRRRKGKPSLRLKKIMVPIDFSKASENALPWATFLAAQFDAEIILLHVVQRFLSDYVFGRELMNETFTPLLKYAEARLKGMAANLSKSSGLRVSAVVRNGRPFKEICNAALRLGTDLVAMTTHGYTGLSRVWLGSTAERVIRHATCPVLVVRSRKAKSG